MAVSAVATAGALITKSRQANRTVRMRMTGLTLNARLRCWPWRGPFVRTLTLGVENVSAVLPLGLPCGRSAERRCHQAQRRAVVCVGHARIEHHLRAAERRQ